MERTVHANGIDLWCETFGDPANPTILLIMGAGTQAVGWPPEFCTALASRGGHVVRYDARDTGKSTYIVFDEAPYTLTDLADDATGLLDALDVDAAHVVGLSLGGMVAQELAIDHADRVHSLTSWMSTPTITGPVSGFWVRDDLPGARPSVEQAFASLLTEPPADDIEASLRVLRAVAGSGTPFDEDAHRQLRRLETERSRDLAASGNHNLAVRRSRDRSDLLASITIPTLVIHGSDDPIVPVEHGIATAKAIPGAELLIIDGMGHDFPLPSYSFTPTIVDAIIDHTAGATHRAA